VSDSKASNKDDKSAGDDPFDLSGILGSIQHGLEEAGIGVDLSGD